MQNKNPEHFNEDHIDAVHEGTRRDLDLLRIQIEATDEEEEGGIHRYRLLNAYLREVEDADNLSKKDEKLTLRIREERDALATVLGYAENGLDDVQ